MDSPDLLHRIALAALVTFAVGTAKAQVFIPDTLERQALNSLIPGIVDAVGIMDTTQASIADLDTASVQLDIFLPSGSAAFIGFKYLDSLKSLTFDLSNSAFNSFSVNGLPSGLKHYGVYISHGGPDSLQLHNIPAGLQTLNVQATSSHLVFGTMPDSLHYMVATFQDITWQGSVKTGSLSLDCYGPEVVLPAGMANSLFVMPDAYDQFLDLSAFTCDSVTFVTGINAFGTLTVQGWTQDMSKLSMNFFDDQMGLCLASLPNGLASLDLTNYDVTQQFCLPNWPASLTSCQTFIGPLGPNDFNYCSVLNSSCPGSNPGISGRVFMDLDGNGQYDPGEPGLPTASVSLQPSNYIVGCDLDGTWQVGVLPGSYTMVPSSYYPYVQSFTPTTHTADLPAMGMADTHNDFAAFLIPDIQDLQARLDASPAVPGFNSQLYLSCRNFGTVPMDAQLVLDLDPDQSWVGSSIAPGSISGNTATWDVPGLAVGSTISIVVELNTAANVPLGTTLNYHLVVLPDSSDETPENNIVNYTDSVVGSYDPNDKLVTPSTLSPAEVQAGETRLNYTVRFQNTGTFMAQRVVIADTLPAGLQVASIQILGASHPHQWYVDHGVLYILFNGINLPDSISDEVNSHGYVRFTILPETSLADGAVIANVAHIVFDFNAPIATPAAVFRVDASTSLAEYSFQDVRVFPNPVHDRIWLMCQGQKAVFGRFQVQDLLGRTWLEGSLSPDGAVDVSQLPAGSFLITSFGMGTRETARFVKL